MPEERARAALERGFCGRLATVGRDGWPYVVPLLYVWRDGDLWLHHTSAHGHLRDNVDFESRVCFEVDEPGEVFAYGRFECDTSVSYASVIAFGRIRIVDDRDLKIRFFEDLILRRLARATEGILSATGRGDRLCRHRGAHHREGDGAAGAR